MAGESVGESDERIEFEKQPDRGAEVDISSGAGGGTQRGEDQERKEEKQKEDLRDPAQER
jgi:hypothetical protein